MFQFNFLSNLNYLYHKYNNGRNFITYINIYKKIATLVFFFTTLKIIKSFAFFVYKNEN